ncbi:2'-5' RNA ligase family protein [Nocardioides ferulae]|uniref:2'-5' RNA ligase family protein n=1 Tax=Nocardioides ferulae TaxID=2340821 RepID=UPI000EB08ADF|nr:2'-5' RNA ligase family protein [Nocardioides ferulae]
MQSTLSAVIVPIPGAERTVAAHRARHDRASSWGVPAHVTVLYPFVPPAAIDQDVLTRVARAVEAVPRFDVAFERSEWFGDSVLWLAPEPSAPFEELTAVLSDAFPEHPPYGGAFEEVVPHLTVGHDAELAELLRAEAAVRAGLPVRGRVDAVQVWAGSQAPGTWACLAHAPLG